MEYRRFFLFFDLFKNIVRGKQQAVDRPLGCPQVPESVAESPWKESQPGCIDCGASVETHSKRCPQCWDDRCGAGGGDASLT